MDDKNSPPQLPRRRRRRLSSADISSETPITADRRPSETTTRDTEIHQMSRLQSPIDIDDLLTETLLRLPPLPPSLPTAALVCTRWHRLVTDPCFLRRFRARHWNPLGAFLSSFPSGHKHISFSFLSDPRGPIPPKRRGGSGDYTWEFQGCRHGRVLLISRIRHREGLRQVLVWDPVAGEHHLLGTPPFSDPNWDRSSYNVNGAIICASGDRPAPFKVALVWNGSRSAHVCVYSSETGVWSDVVTAEVQSESNFVVSFPNVLVGNSIYWNLFGFGSQFHILEFDLGSQNLAVTEVPLPSDVYANHRGIYLTTLAKGGGVSVIVMSADLRAQVWERTPDSDGVARWMPGGTIELDRLRPLRSGEHGTELGLDGDNNVMFVSTYRGVFMVSLVSMQFEKIFETNPVIQDGTIDQFMNLYAPGTGSVKCSLGS